MTEIIGQMAREDTETLLGSAVDHYSALLNAADPGMCRLRFSFVFDVCRQSSLQGGTIISLVAGVIPKRQTCATLRQQMSINAG